MLKIPARAPIVRVLTRLSIGLCDDRSARAGWLEVAIEGSVPGEKSSCKSPTFERNDEHPGRQVNDVDVFMIGRRSEEMLKRR